MAPVAEISSILGKVGKLERTIRVVVSDRSWCTPGAPGGYRGGPNTRPDPPREGSG